jgi:hypothetical protein
MTFNPCPHGYFARGDCVECKLVRAEAERAEVARRLGNALITAADLRADIERSSAAFDATVRTLRRDKGIAEAERDALRKINSDLSTSKNQLLVDGVRLEERAERAVFARDKFKADAVHARTVAMQIEGECDALRALLAEARGWLHPDLDSPPAMDDLCNRIDAALREVK